MSFPPDGRDHLTVIGDGYCLYGCSLGAACLAGDIPQIRRSPISGCAWLRIGRAGSFSILLPRGGEEDGLGSRPYSLTSFPCMEDRCRIRICRSVERSGTPGNEACSRAKADRQAAWLPVGNMFPGSGVSRHSPDVFWQQQAEHNENRRCGPHKEDADRNG